jgi:LDH2 family malate/lactate/ureidoglycolate dehydrogenase
LTSASEVILAIDPNAIGAPALAARVTEYLSALRHGRPDLLLPDQRERAERERRLEHGIPVPIALWRRVQALVPDRHEPPISEADVTRAHA